MKILHRTSSTRVCARALPKYLTLEESRRLLAAVDGPNRARDYAILLLFLNCGIRRAELVGLNRNDIYNDRIRVTGKGNKERFVYFGETTREALDTYLPERNKIVLDDDRALFGSRDHRRLSVTAVHRLDQKHMLAAGWTRSNTPRTSCATPPPR